MIWIFELPKEDGQVSESADCKKMSSLAGNKIPGQTVLCSHPPTVPFDPPLQTYRRIKISEIRELVCSRFFKLGDTGMKLLDIDVRLLQLVEHAAHLV